MSSRGIAKSFAGRLAEYIQRAVEDASGVQLHDAAMRRKVAKARDARRKERAV